MQTVTRKGSFDAAHRVMNERMKCFHLHGHTYLYELTFEFKTMDDIGYAIDFKEIKRVGAAWIEDYLDHGFIANPQDTGYIDIVKKHNNKIWLMSLNGEGNYCNPTAENIAKEIFMAMNELVNDEKNELTISNVRLYETPNCYVDCNPFSFSLEEYSNWCDANIKMIKKYAIEKGTLEYDDRKL